MNELKIEELQEVNGGGWKEAGQAFAGTVGMAAAPVVCVGDILGCKGYISKNWEMIQIASKNAYKKKK